MTTMTAPPEPGVADWSLWTTTARLVVTDPSALAQARALVDARLARIEAAASETTADSCPCRNGLPAAAGLLQQIAYGRSTRATVVELRRIVGLVDGRGACQHPGGTARLIRSTMRTFADEAARHATGGCSSAPHLDARRRTS